MPRLRRLLRRSDLVAAKVRSAVPLQLRDLAARLPVRDGVVLFEAYGGRGVLCHPEAIFRALLDAPDLAHLRHVWVLTAEAAATDVGRELAAHPRVTVVRPGTAAYIRQLATARWLVNNATFPPGFGKRPGQVYLNTWHGTPLKSMGYDQPDGITAARNVVRNLLMADFVLTSGEYMTQHMYEGGYRLGNIFRGEVIDEGGPRTDRQILEAGGRERVLARLRRAGLVVADGDRIVLYAPTWQGESFSTARDDAEVLGERVRELTRLLPAGHRVLLRVHQQVYAAAAGHAALAGILAPSALPANEVLGVTDVLVSDYSSIFFDYLGTGRPIVFFTPDEEAYTSERGVYLDLSALPGPTTHTIPELAETVAAVGTGTERDPVRTHGPVREGARGRFAAKDDGHAAERVIDIVFRGRRDGYAVGPLAGDGRTTMLVHVGGMKPNGITTSALGVLRHLDHDRFDVTAVFDSVPEPDRLANVALLPPQVRPLPRIGAFALGSLLWYVRRELFTRGGRMRERDRAAMAARFETEWRRCYGDARFDLAVDFSGYSPTWSYLLARAPDAFRAIWLHNDLLADQQRTVAGERAHEDNLGSVFGSYRHYDRLVSVSAALRDINARSLAAYAPAERFVAARNTVDGARVLTGAAAPLDPEVLERRADLTTFVTVGRVSPEKNHERLVRAFADTHAERPDTRLVIIGDGPLREHVGAVAAELGVADAVVLTGQQANPFAILAACDVFVLSSDYEGQPMVILEALVLGLPVVATAFGSVRSALPEGVGLVVERTVPALADGMRAALRGEVAAATLDVEAYNAEVMAELYDAIGVGEG